MEGTPSPYAGLRPPAWMALGATDVVEAGEQTFSERVQSDENVRRYTLHRVQSQHLDQERLADGDVSDGDDGFVIPEAAPSLAAPPEGAFSREPAFRMDSEGPEVVGRGKRDSALHLFQGSFKPYDHSREFQRIFISDMDDGHEDRDVQKACEELRCGFELRQKWVSQSGKNHMILEEDGTDVVALQATKCSLVGPPGSPQASNKYRRRAEPSFKAPFGGRPYLGEAEALPKCDVHFVDGVFRVFYQEEGREQKQLWQAPSADDFFEDFFRLRAIVTSGPVKSISYKRLKLLEARFELHAMLNGDRELAAQKSVPHRDFYNVRKVDTHVHHSACMNQKHLLRYIKHKLKHNEDEIVSFRDGLFMTLTEVFDSLRLTAYDLSIDTLDMHANNTFHRFDRFNLKYNPAGQSRLREIFLKTHNLIGGQYLAEITREVCDDLTASKYQFVEWRVSIYGRGLMEWDRLSRWFYVNRLAHPNVRWMVQIPRLYFIYKKTGAVENFGEMLFNIFHPLFEVTKDPKKNLPLHAFLKTTVGFDSVDDESKPEPVRPYPGRTLPPPELWDNEHNPPYSYWSYYLWANIAALNHMRAAKGLNTFSFRPHCGEAGDLDHLIATYLVADEINHGILLRKLPGLHYLYYLTQIGIAVSPLSNNKLFLDYNKNPFIKYFAQGLNVSLSTDDPLMLHYTKDPLLEEYSVAAQVWKLSSTDQCEIARNSVLQRWGPSLDPSP
uniref:AMP deaminase n=1 Tax=Phaeomonas parva TaxID=124430 RepID=A0A7S1XP69_9STRA